MGQQVARNMDTALEPGFPLYHRIAATLERAITEGSLRTGDRLI